MFDIENQTHYEVLELTADASPQEIQLAYHRVKQAFARNSGALYSLVSDEETQSLIRRIEEAFRVLSSPESRRRYDHQGFPLIASAS